MRDKDHAEVKDILLSYNFVMEDSVPDAIGASDLYRLLKKKEPQYVKAWTA